MRPLPTTARGKRSRATIVDAAARLMHDRGLAAPSMDDVLAASGTGKSQLYHYFDGKQELVEAVLHHQFDRILTAQPALTDDTCADLTQWRDEVLQAHRDSGMGTCPLGAFVGQTDHDPALRATLADLFDRWQVAIAGLVTRAVDAGAIRDDADPTATASALLTALQGGTMLAHLGATPEPLASALNTIVDSLTPRK
jgi:TetR/AcrR family transcriptional regulator, transcriptional repressor for nem operon